MGQKAVEERKAPYSSGPKKVVPKAMNDPKGRVTILRPMAPSDAAYNIEVACEIIGSNTLLAEKMGYANRSIITKWKKRGGCPLAEAWRIEILTGGKILAEEVCSGIVYRCA